MDKQIHVGPDKGWSWVIAFAACFNSLILAGIFRTSGFLFVAFIHEFNVSREEASWPVVLCISVLNLIGIVTGPLGQRFGVRPVVIFGSIVATLGLSLCYLTHSLGLITFLFGIIFGTGYGLVSTLMPVIVNEYFLNHRATANGIANSGSCLGSIILPLLFEFFIDEYGLSGCFLLTGGIVLHVAVSGSLMRPAPWLKRSNHTIVEIKVTTLEESSMTVNTTDTYSLSNGYNSIVDGSTDRYSSFIYRDTESETPCLKGMSKGDSSTKAHCSKSQSKISLEEDIYNSIEDLKESLDRFKEVCNSSLKTSSEYKSIPNSNETDASDDASTKLIFHGQNSLKVTKSQIPADKELNKNIEVSQNGTNLVLNRTYDLEGSDGSNTNFSSYDRRHSNIPTRSPTISSSFKRVLSCPMFYITACTNVSFYFLFHMYVVIIVDFSLDRGVASYDTKYILSAFAISDLVGRLCLGWITDRKFLLRQHFVMMCMTLIGFTFCLFPSVYSFTWLMIVSSVYGLLLGCTMVVFPILLVDFLGMEIHAIAMGCMCFLNGLVALIRPFLIGYFRDNLGSYSNIFYVLGGISLVSSFLWMLENCFVKIVKTNTDISP